ncbi:MAG: tetratricopeptide repeat protein [Bacteroidetes bacterium]|nr:tetratricopeptide repeat protein [Bacteroidota bacterium]
MALKNAKHDTVRCDILYQLSAVANDEEWPKYNQQLLALAENKLQSNSPSKKTYLRYLAEATNNVGFLAQMQNDTPEALKCFNKSFNIFQELLDKEGMASTLNNMASIYEDQEIFQLH